MKPVSEPTKKGNMKIIEFEDSHRNIIRVQHSSSINPSVWIYLKGDQFVEKKDEHTGHDIPVALHLSHNQAEMLILALQEFIQEE